MRSQNLKEVTLDEIQMRFIQRRPIYERFASKLQSLLHDDLNELGLDNHKIEFRVKEPDSFFRKIKNHQPKYERPLLDVPDIIGLRVIVHVGPDQIVVDRRLEELFDIDWSRSERKADSKKPNEFGYESNHYVVTLKKNRGDLPEWKRYADLHAEIQTRTVLQHAWAVVSHKRVYKREDEAPAALHSELRELNKLSALLSIADDAFAKMMEKERILTDEYVSLFRSGNFEGEINLTSLTAYLNVVDARQIWSQIASTQGFGPCQVWLEGDNKSATELDRTLLVQLRCLQITKIEELHRILKVAIEDKEELRKVSCACREFGFIPLANPLDVIAVSALLFGSAKTLSHVNALGFRPQLRNALCKVLSLGCFGKFCESVEP